MLAASATTASGAARGAADTERATAPIGVLMITRSAPVTASFTVVHAVSPLRAAARAATSGSVSQPRTVQPARAAAIAMDVPIKPVPTIATRSAGRSAEGSGVGIEVIAQRFRPVEIHVDDLPEPALGVEVHQDPYHRTHRALDGDLARAEQRYDAEAHPPRRLCRERRAEVFGRREQDAHEVVRGDVVPFDHLFEEALGRPQHVFLAIGSDDDGPPGGTHPHAYPF